METQARFPVGGPRQPVYDFLRDNGFIMSRHSDKTYNRADGLTLHLYGAGSMARIFDKDRNVVAEDALDAAVAKVQFAK